MRDRFTNAGMMLLSGNGLFSAYTDSGWLPLRLQPELVRRDTHLPLEQLAEV
ncbi:MAG: hypothetical protein K0R57_4498 [Paenibacillaceae bacterium]|jgi:hypothetical protein|nr:hypothetical protein [Paenibacillaceae bacterium]